MSTIFTLTSSNGSSVSFDHDEATDTAQTKPYYSIEKGSEKSSGGSIKSQVRPGKRYVKYYSMNLSLTKYISFINLYTDQSTGYFINYTTVPELLSNDSSISITNDFEVDLDYDNAVQNVGGAGTRYKFRLGVLSSELL